MKRVFLSALVLTISLASPAAAATLVTNAGAQLTGATGVVVNGATYDVEFIDDRCTAIFGGCDSVSDFTFQNAGDAGAAAQALLDQVFIGQFDTDYSLTFGCPGIISITISCEVLVPFQTPFLSFYDAFAIAAFNGNDLADGTAQVQFDPVDDLSDGGDDRFLVFARFTPASAVPEPSTWALLLFGFGALGARLRRRPPTPKPNKVVS
jgi:hypothetical protein